MRKTVNIPLKTELDLKQLRTAGKILAEVIAELKSSLTPGMTTADIDAVTERLIRQRRVQAAFKGYRGFPACACVSVNEEVVHGIPGKRVIQDGDIVSVDVGIVYEGYYADTAYTAGIGSVSNALEELLQTTQNALMMGIAAAKAGNHLSDISHAIQSFVEGRGFSIVRDFVGHGIGRDLHEEPEIPNFGPPNEGPVLKEGMVFAIEPMVNVGSWKTRIMDDGWTVKTWDGQPSAHYEHCVAITADGPEILTQ